MELNSDTWHAQRRPVDDTAPDGTPCATKVIDVKMTETDLPLFFQAAGLFSSVDFINTQARVEIRQRERFSGALPVGVPDTNPKVGRVTFIDEATGAVLGSREITHNGSQNGLAIWDNSSEPFPLTVDRDADRRPGGLRRRHARPPAASRWSSATTPAPQTGSCSRAAIRWRAPRRAAECPARPQGLPHSGHLPGPLLPRRDRRLHDRRPRRGRLRRLRPALGGRSEADREGGRQLLSDDARKLPAGRARRRQDERRPGNDQRGRRPGARMARLGGDETATRAATPAETTPATGARAASGRRARRSAELRRLELPQRARSTSRSSGRAARAGRTRSSAARPSQTSCTHDLVAKIGIGQSVQVNATTVDDPIVELRFGAGGSQNQALDCDPAIANLQGRDRHRMRAGVRAQPGHGVSEHARRLWASA